MTASSPNSSARSTLWGLDRNLAVLLGGAILLIIAGLIAIPLAARRTPVLAAETTPEGVVQRFYQALYKSDYTTAHSYLASEIQDRVTVAKLQESLQYTVRDSQLRTTEVNVNGENATVRASMTYFGSGSLFDSNEWTTENEILLKREGESWKLVSGFGVYTNQ